MSDSHPPRLIAYIDEAGDAGSKYGQGSSHFLAIGATVTAINSVDTVTGIFNAAREERGHAKTFKKFSSNNDKDNFVLTKLLGQQPIRTVAVAIHKPSMTGSHIRSNPQKEYQFLIKWALERISWLARDSARGGPAAENRCQLYFSEQRSYPYEDLCEYLNKLQNGQERFNCSIEWDYLDATIKYGKHKNEHPIHFADLTASAFHRAIDPKHHGMTDDRFFRKLMPTIYNRGRKYYGLKLFPPRSIEKLRETGELEFLKLIQI